MKFFRHVISSIVVDPTKKEVVTKWQKPTNAHEICHFLGLVGYYWRFIAGVSRLSNPLTTLTKKNAKFMWSEGCEMSFQELKMRLTIAPILALPKPHKPYMIYSDASMMCLRCVLMQKGQVVAYAS